MYMQGSAMYVKLDFIVDFKKTDIAIGEWEFWARLAHAIERGKAHHNIFSSAPQMTSQLTDHTFFHPGVASVLSNVLLYAFLHSFSNLNEVCTVVIDKDRHSTNSSHETSIPKESGVHTVHILQGLQGFVLNVDFGIYLDHIFSRHVAGVHVNTKLSQS